MLIRTSSMEALRPLEPWERRALFTPRDGAGNANNYPWPHYTLPAKDTTTPETKETPACKPSR